MKKVRKALCLGLAASMVAGCCISASAKGPATTDEVTERETRNSEVSKELATEGMVLLQNNNNTLPIARQGNIAVFGTGAERTVKGGTGSGDVNQREVVSVAQGFRNAGFKVTTQDYLDAYEAAATEFDANQPPAGMSPPPRCDDIDITDAMMNAAKTGTNTAVYVLSRVAGEFVDRREVKGDYYASDMEVANLKKIAANFENVILVINTGGAIDTNFIRENTGIDSVIIMGQAGQRGGDALVELLTGVKSPSGKLTATWPMDYDDTADAAYWGANDNNIVQEDYQDGIYVGYRYFDTFNVTPAYEFGYGLSYTTFDISMNNMRVDGDKITVNVSVTNTGSYNGKEVVQVYFSAPDGKLDKPYQELAAFAKTNELKPGETQVLKITFNTTEMSSYDEDQAAYIMEDGNYIIRVGNSSRNTHVAAVVHLDKDVITEQLSNQLVADKDMKELSSKDARSSYTYSGEQTEIDRAPVINLSASSIKTVNNASPYDSEDSTVYVSDTTEEEYLNENLGYQLDGSFGGKYPNHPSSYNEIVVKEAGDFSKSTLKDVYDGKITMEQFVSGLTVAQMADIVIGGNKLPSASGQSAGAASSNTAGISDGTMIGAQANSVSGAAGETAGIYIESKSIPNIVLADGPAGLRITREVTVEAEEEGGESTTYYQFCTAFPSGTVLAQSWNTDCFLEKGTAVGEELVEYGITLWLAPGMNIHKNALCGRNFEYYSEDPFLAGMVGTGETLGVQSNPGVGVTIKHFYGNNQEDNRNAVNNTISERASREIYLKQFEMVVKAAQPMAIMTSYNLNNGVPAADDFDMLMNVARGEWGFQGLIMTDWGGGQSTPAISMHAGNDLIMPGRSVENITKEAFADVEPTFPKDDIYPTVTVAEGRGGLSATTAWGEFVLNENGKTTIVKTVDTEDYESATRPAVVNGEEGEVLVSELIAGQKAIKVETKGDETTITYTGDYVNNNISLGDLQRSTANILRIVMASNQFADMFSDVTSAPYSEQFADDLAVYLTVE